MTLHYCGVMMHRVFLLSIHGLHHEGRPVRLYSGRIAPPPATDSVTGFEFVDVPGLRGPESITSAISIRGGISPVDEIVVEVDTARRRNRQSGRHRRTEADAVNPGTILTRRGYKMASAAALLLESIPSRAAIDEIKIDRDPAVFGVLPRVIHVNREAFWVTGSAGDGSTGDPYRFTGVTRAIFGTLPAAHLVRVSTGRRPFVLAECVSWRSRRATLYECEVLSGIKLSPIKELRRCFLQHAPRRRENRITVEMSPMSAAFDRKFGSTASIRLASGYRYLDGRNRISVGFALGFDRGGAWAAFNHPETVDGEGRINLNSTAQHAATMDLTLPGSHPRIGKIYANGQLYQPTGYNAFPTGINIQFGPDGDVGEFDPVVSAATNELHIVDLMPPGDPPKLIKWPFALYEAMASIRTEDHTGMSGMWAKVFVNPNTRPHPMIDVRSNVPSAGPLYFTAWPFDRWMGGDFGPSPMGQYPGENELRGTPAQSRMCTHAIDMAAPDDARWEAWSRRVKVADDDATLIPIRGICKGGVRERYETFLLVLMNDGDVDIPDGGSNTLEVKHTPRGASDRMTSYCDVKEKIDLGDGLFALRLTERSRRRLPTLADWYDVEPTVIQPAIRMQRQRAVHALLRMMQSGGGHGVLGTFDTEVSGCEIPEDDIDVQSFARFSWLVDEWEPTIHSGDNFSDFANPILQLNGAAVVDVVEDGLARIKLVGVGETGEPARHSLTKADWALDQIPEEIVEVDIANLVTVKYRLGSDDDATEVRFEDSGSIEFYGEAEEIEVDARGLQFAGRGEAYTMLRDAVAGIFYRVGYAPKVWEASTTTKAGEPINAGDVVEISGPDFKISDTWGVKGLRARVMSITKEKQKVGASMILRQLAVEVRYWGAGAIAEAMVDATTLKVARNRFSEATDPATGEALTDSHGFVAGDDAILCAPYDHDNFVNVVISGVNANQIQFTAAPAPAYMAAGALLLPADYLDATERQREGSHLANASGRLGGLPGDPAVELVE